MHEFRAVSSLLQMLQTSFRGEVTKMYLIITLALLCNLQILHEYSALENFWKRYNKVYHKQDYQL